MNDSLRQLFTHNLALKIISLALALGMWLMLSGDPIAEVAVEVPIVFRNIPENLGISYAAIPRAQILLRGPDRAVRKLQPTDISAEVDVNGIDAGPRSFSAKVVRVHLPHDLKVANVEPNHFEITFIRVGPTAQTNAEPHN